MRRECYSLLSRAEPSRMKVASLSGVLASVSIVLPALAPQIGALWLFTAVPAQAQTTLLSATLNVKEIGGGSNGHGCWNATLVLSVRCSTTATLSDDDFAYDGTDYAITGIVSEPGTVFVSFDKVVPQGLRTATLNIGSFALALSNPTTVSGGGTVLSWNSGSHPQLTLGSAISVSLVSPSTVTLSASPNPVTEGSSVTVTATLSSALTSSVTVPVTLTDNTAESGDHGTLTSITIAANATSGTGTISTNQDTDEDDETFTVALGNLPDGYIARDGYSSVQVTITDVGGGGGGGGDGNDDDGDGGDGDGDGGDDGGDGDGGGGGGGDGDGDGGDDGGDGDGGGSDDEPSSCTLVAPYWSGPSGGFTVRPASGSRSVRVTCGGSTTEYEAENGVVTRLVRSSCRGTGLRLEGAAPGGWYWQHGERNAAAAPLVCSEDLGGPRAVVPGGVEAAATDTGTWFKHDTARLIGIVPHLAGNECGEYVTPYWQGRGGVVVRPAEGGTSVQVRVQCGATSSTMTPSSGGDGVIAESVRKDYCSDDEGDPIQGRLTVTGAAPGGWYWVRGERNAAVAPLMCADLLGGPAAVDPGGVTSRATEDGTYFSHDTDRLIGVVPHVASDRDDN